MSQGPKCPQSLLFNPRVAFWELWCKQDRRHQAEASGCGRRMITQVINQPRRADDIIMVI